MAKCGTVIHNPLQGQTVRFRAVGSETDGELIRFEATVAPGGFVPLAHRHRVQEEHFRVLSGSIGCRIGRGKGMSISSGETLTLPPNTPHIWWNDGQCDAIALVELRPALDFDVFLETLFGLAREARTDSRGNPGLLQSAALARRYECYLASPPVSIQRAGVALLSLVAGCLGYRASYPMYSSAEAQAEWTPVAASQ